jgi:hypothetical protein
MQYKSQLHHHYLECDETGVCPTKVGIEIFDTGSVFQKATACGHMDFPLDTKETIEAYLKEKRNNPCSPAQLYNQLPDI